jgi:hypothetical protein
MAIRIRAHYDGQVIVPDEPIDLPINETLDIEIQPSVRPGKELTPEERRAAFERVVARAIHGLNISDESLRRENLYDERL